MGKPVNVSTNQERKREAQQPKTHMRCVIQRSSRTLIQSRASAWNPLFPWRPDGSKVRGIPFNIEIFSQDPALLTSSGGMALGQDIHSPFTLSWSVLGICPGYYFSVSQTEIAISGYRQEHFSELLSLVCFQKPLSIFLIVHLIRELVVRLGIISLSHSLLADLG